MPKILDQRTREQIHELYYMLHAPTYRIAGFLGVSKNTVHKVVTYGVNYDGRYNLQERVNRPLTWENGCLLHPNKHLKHQRRLLRIPVASYLGNVGDLPPTRTVTAVCHNPRCARVDHLKVIRKRGCKNLDDKLVS